MHQSQWRLALLLYFATLTGCQISGYPISGVVEPLPHFDAAQRIAPRSAPKVLHLRNVNTESFPPMVPFARVVVDRSLGGETTDLVFEMASTLQADVVDVMAVERRHWGLHSNANRQREALIPARVESEPSETVAVCYRVSPGDLRIRTDGNQMVLVLENESARRAGLLEGDTLLSLDGIPYDPVEQRDALYSWQLATQPGDAVTLAWDRVGKGRMEGRAVVLPTTSDYLETPDLVDHFLKLQQQARLSRSRGF